MSRLDELIAALLAGDLAREDRAELEAALAADPAALAQAIAAYRLVQVLPLVLRGRGGDRFVEAVTRRIRPPSGRFVARVRDSVRRRAIARETGGTPQ